MFAFLMTLFMSSYVWYKGSTFTILVRDVDLDQFCSAHLHEFIGLVLIAFAAAVTAERLPKGARMTVVFLAPVVGIALAVFVGY